MNDLKKLLLLIVALGSFCALAYNLIGSPDWQTRRWPQTQLRALYVAATAKLLFNPGDVRQQYVIDAIKARDPQIEETIFRGALISSGLTVVVTAALNVVPMLLGIRRGDSRVRGSQLVSASGLRRLAHLRIMRRPLLLLGTYLALSSVAGAVLAWRSGAWLFLAVIPPCGAALYFLAEYLSRGTPRPYKTITVGGVPIPPELEGRHILVSGTTGAGKSQAIYKMVIDARARGDRGLVMDIGGAYRKRFRRRGDIVLAPGDTQSVKWNPFLEIRSAFDFYELARAAIPDGHGDSHEWHEKARVLFANVMEKLYKKGDCSVSRLLHLVCVAQRDELKKVVAGTPADVLTQDGNERLLQNTRGITATYIQPWLFLPDNGDFSIKEWIRNGRQGQWLFVAYRDDQIAALRQLLACWMQLAIVETLCLDDDMAVPTWFIADEFDSLGQISAAKDALTKLRKYQGRCVFGIQTVAQLWATYGREIAQVLLSCLSTKLYLRCGDPETAEYCSKSLGDQEILRQERSRSRRGLLGLGGDPSRSDAERHVTHRIVLPSELENLPDLVGYLSIAGDYPTARVKIPIPKF